MESSSLPACSRGHYIAERFIRGLALAVGILVLSFPAFPQSSTGRILGSVHDKSDAAGEFVAPDLLPGVYKVTAQAKGFKTLARENVRLEVAQDVRIDLVLQP